MDTEEPLSRNESPAKDSTPTDVAFLYKTMIQRDPSKRKVKPVEKHLMQIHFGMSDEDEDEDSDYEFKPEGGSDDGGSDDDAKSGDVDDDVGDHSSDDEVGSEELPEEEPVSKKQNHESDTITNSKAPLLKESSAVRRFVGMRVCCVCLTSSSGDDEIIECDGCGILVHEGCYGIIDDDAASLHSDMSTESTEPWFCDGCKSGLSPSCELCPNQFGIFKQTDTGRWVHLICALYVPAVAFGNTERLTNVTLLEMPYTKWGSKECSLCDKENLSYTGVCIGCDAGMCKTYFHVTCAQKHGLLSEASIDEDIADPFYAHCKMHGDKYVSKQKRRNFLTLHSHVKQFREEKKNKPVPPRIKKRLDYFKRKFKEAEAKRPAAWIPPNKLPRALSSSAGAVRSLMRKAELLDITSAPKSTVQRPEIVKKSYVAPDLTVEFTSYFHQRKHKIESIKKQTDEAVQQIKLLKEQEKELQGRIDKLKLIMKDLDQTYEEQSQTALAIYRVLNSLSSEIEIPQQLMEKAGAASLSYPERRNEQINYTCGICSQTEDQHLLAKCDECHNYYHLGCLDPPLTRMPKKTKQCGWVCSICDHKSQAKPASPDRVIDTEAPRMLRQSIKEPDKFILPELQLYVEKRRQASQNARIRKRSRPSQSLRSRSAKTKVARVELKPMTTEDVKAHSQTPAKPTDTGEPSVDAATTANPSKSRKVKHLPTGICKRCDKECNSGNAVRCDQCEKWYHFACLNPPMKKSPKPRGYLWYCDECETDNDEEQSNVKDSTSPTCSTDTNHKEPEVPVAADETSQFTESKAKSSPNEVKE